MAKCRRPLPQESQQILQEMTSDLRDRLRVFGWTHSALAMRLERDRSRVSHALASGGEEMPSRRLIQSSANALDAYAAEHNPSLRPLTLPTMRRWFEASRIRSRTEKRELQESRRAIDTRLEGAPPASMNTHQDLLRALNALITRRFGSQRAMCRAWGLGRPVVSAALGDRRSLSIELMDSILRACGVRGTDLPAWHDAWQRLARPRQLAALERQRAGMASPITIESKGHDNSLSGLLERKVRHGATEPGTPLARRRRQAQPRGGHTNEPTERSA